MTTLAEIRAKTAMLAGIHNNPFGLAPQVYEVLSPRYIVTQTATVEAARPEDLRGGLGLDPTLRSQRLAEQERERQRDEAVTKLAGKLESALRSKGLSDQERGAVSEALVAVREGRTDAALAVLEGAAELR